MKICACIAEYNPFHLGHLKHVDYIKNELKANKLIVIMSGNFTQRGEPAILDKFTRARHAIIAGADMVIELPTIFATANAECFAKGAVNLINSLGVVDGLCFGVESGEKSDFLSLATELNSESKEYKRALKSQLENGISLAKAKFLALKETGKDFDEKLINSPNNILGIEYTKALLSLGSTTQIYPMIRLGDHNDSTLKKGISSATSIRGAIKGGKKSKTKKCVPPFVYKDLTDYPYLFDKLVIAKIISTSLENLSLVPDCTEGLENRIKALTKDNRSLETLIEKISTKRYTKTRISRILTASLLGIEKDFLSTCLYSPLYAKVLAVNSDSLDLISTISKNSKVPVLTRKSDIDSLKKTALKCWELDCLANDIYNLVSDKNVNENQMLIV